MPPKLPIPFKRKKRGPQPLEGNKLKENVTKKIDDYINAVNKYFDSRNQADLTKANQIKATIRSFITSAGRKYEFDPKTLEVKDNEGNTFIEPHKDKKKILEKWNMIPELADMIFEKVEMKQLSSQEENKRQEDIKKRRQESAKIARETKTRNQEERKKQAEQQQKQQQTATATEEQQQQQTETKTEKETKTETAPATETKKEKKARLKAEKKDEQNKEEAFRRTVKMEDQIARQEAEEQLERTKKEEEEKKQDLKMLKKKALNKEIENYAKAKTEEEQNKSKRIIKHYLTKREEGFFKNDPVAQLNLDDDGNIESIIDEEGNDIYEQIAQPIYTERLKRQILQPSTKSQKQQSELIDSEIRTPPDAINTNPNIPGVIDQLEVDQTNNQQTNINAKSYNELMEESYERQQKNYTTIDAESYKLINRETKEENEISINLGIPDQTSETQQREEKENVKQSAMDIISEENKNPLVTQTISNMLDMFPALSNEVISTVDGNTLEELERETKKNYEINVPQGHLKNKLDTLQEAGGNRQDVELKRDYYDDLEDKGDYLDDEDYDYEDFEDYDEAELTRIVEGQRGVINRFQRQIRNVGETLSGVSIPYLGVDSPDESKNFADLYGYGLDIPDPIRQVGGQLIRQVGQRAGEQVINRGIEEISRRIRGKKPTEEITEEQLLLDQLKRINENLDRGGSYPDEKPIQRYRFPEPYENYNAVPLVQNSVTGYLNDYNLYGNIQGVNMDEI